MLEGRTVSRQRRTRRVGRPRPEKRTVTIYRAGETARVLTEDDDLEDRDLLPGFRYPLRRLFN